MTQSPDLALPLQEAKDFKIEQQILLYHFWLNYSSPKKTSKEIARKLSDRLAELQGGMPDRSMMAPPIRLLYEEMDESFRKVYACYAPQQNESVSFFDDLGFD